MPHKLQLVEPNDPVLRMVADRIPESDIAAVQALIENMLFSVTEYEGVGLAAPQIGASKQIIVVASKPNSRYPYAPDFPAEAMINPEIVRLSDEQELGWEGCLSVPGSRGQVPRSKHITLTYQDREGEHHQKDFEGFLARIIQHEVDHLHGKTFVDRMENPKDLISEETFQSLLEEAVDEY